MTTTNTQQHADVSSFMANLDANKVQHERLRSELSNVVANLPLGGAGTGGRSSSNNNNNNKSSSRRQQHPFQASLEKELRRIQKFVNEQQEALEVSAKTLFLQAHHVATAENDIEKAKRAVLTLQQQTDATVQECIALQNFLTHSCHSLAHIAETADDKLRPPLTSVPIHATPLVHDILLSRVGGVHLNSALVCVVSDIYHALGQAQEKIRHHGQKSAQDTVWVAPSSFQRSTTKYWVKDENLTKLMMICATEAPLLVYGRKGPLTSTNPRQVKVSEGDKFWESLATKITSIYFDSYQGTNLYQERLARGQGAQLLRARWYGTTRPVGEKIIFLELKTHHEKWVGNKSVKERASIQEQDMLTFLNPVAWTSRDAEEMVLRAKPKLQEGGDDLIKATDLLLRMHKLVVNHNLTACVRTLYDRAAFQSATSNDLRLTLDRNVTVVNERAKPLREGQWCLSDAEAQTARSCLVPFNVFEVKLAKDGAMPAGLAQAQNDTTIELAMKFSKFLTGAAAFNNVPILPYWAAHPAFYSFFELDKRRASSSSGSLSNNSDDEYKLMGSSNDGLMSGGTFTNGVKIAPKFPARVEPKTYFANERTFVQWVSASIMLLTISGFLLDSGDYNSTAAAISLLSFGLVLYSTHLYFIRLNFLKDRQPYGYFNKVNPIALASVVGFAVFCIWIDSMQGRDVLNAAKSESRNRRLLRGSLDAARFFHQGYEKCNIDNIRTNTLIEEDVSSFLVDSKRHSFLMTSNDSVYVQPINDDDHDVNEPAKVDSLIHINESNLQGLVSVHDRLFAVSAFPEYTELIEMAWWGTRHGGERLRIVQRWTLPDSGGQVDGFSLGPSTDSTPMGSFYLKMYSSINVYSVPPRSADMEQGRPSHPVKLKSLNMKVLNQGRTDYDDQGKDSRLSNMITFEGVTYFLKSNANVLEAWNLTEGTLYSEIALPATDAEHEWRGFALERKDIADHETPSVHGDNVSFSHASSVLHLHLMTHEPTFGSQLWNFPVVEHKQKPRSGLFSVSNCHIATASMN